MKFFVKNDKLFAGIIILLMVLSMTGCKKDDSVVEVKKAETNSYNELAENINDGETVETEGILPDGKIMVYIFGEIKNPDVYILDKGSRLCDLVNLAGGYTKKAAIYLNLAAKLTDGQQIKVLSKEEYKNIGEPLDGESEVLGEPSKDNVNDNSGKTNINTADTSELINLPGIGEIKAEAIVEYRDNNGAFKSIDEIKNVSGIGEALYERIKDKIIV